MSFYAWAPKGPKGYGRLHGYTAGLGYTLPGVSLPSVGPTSSGSVATTSSMQVEYSTVDSRAIVRAPGSPDPVSPVTMARHVAAVAPILGPQYAPDPARGALTDVARTIDRAARRVADMSMQSGMDSTQSSGNSSTDAIIPTPGARDDGALLLSTPSDTIPVPSDSMTATLVPTAFPWWAALGLGVLGGAALVGLFGR